MSNPVADFYEKLRASLLGAHLRGRSRGETTAEMFGQMLDNFHRSAIDEKPNDILKNFLRFVIRDGGLSESGSISLFNRADGTLDLFNPDDFLYEEGFLERGKEWAESMRASDGLAGLAFQSKKTQASANVEKDPRYSKSAAHSPIGPMICCPVIASFIPPKATGVVSFHDSPAAKPFEEQEVALAKRAVALLSTILRGVSGGRFVLQSRTIFLIHGHDERARAALEGILKQREVTIKILGNEPRTGFQLLEKLEELITE